MRLPKLFTANQTLPVTRQTSSQDPDSKDSWVTGFINLTKHTKPLSGLKCVN